MNASHRRIVLASLLLAVTLTGLPVVSPAIRVTTATTVSKSVPLSALGW
jgi:hypothetical protein